MLTLSVNFKVQTHVLKTFPIKRWLFLFQYHSSNVSKLLERLDRKNDKRIDFIPHKNFISYRTKEQLVFSLKLPRKGINNQWWPCQWVTLFIECSSYQGNNINHKIRTPQGKLTTTFDRKLNIYLSFNHDDDTTTKTVCQYYHVCKQYKIRTLW